MPSTCDERLTLARDWARRALEQQWLQPADIKALTALENRNPASLFEPDSHRPLVAAFFGGTGVGKSSLLNRLAGRPVARTGVERPTSREVSVYLHESVRISALPAHLPLDQVRIAQHHDSAARQVMWVDMPDIDSIETHNRSLVLEWLPHIDVLIYVVSPERYRDDNGWRLLREHGGDHAWLFVLNQWDRGQDVQFEDFKKLLATAGFRDPVVLRTDCQPIAADRREDDFAALQQLLHGISDRHVMSQLEARAEQSRVRAFEEALQTVLARLGVEENYQNLKEDWEVIWSTAGKDLLTGLEWPMQTAVALFTGREVNPLSRSMDLTQAPAASAPAGNRPLLWDEWAEGRAADALSQMIVAAGNRGLPIRPLKFALADWPGATGRRVLSQGQLMLRQALARPGNSVQRLALKFAGWLAVLLPLGAIGWATYQVVKGYYESAMQHLDYLGADFAVHSLLLITLAWLLPWFACARLKPSLETSALKGLRAGVSAALAGAGEQVEEQLDLADQHRDAVIGEGRDILEGTAELTRVSRQDDRLPGLLGRMVPVAPPAETVSPAKPHEH